jgi:hypothetical protein
VNGQVYHYVRPRGPGGILDGRWKPPSAVAYQRDLYQLPDVADPAESQELELRFFQRIDDRAAIAIRVVDEGRHGSTEDRIALSQFMVSVMHRSPSRLAAIRTELTAQQRGAPYEGLEGEQFDRVLKATANRLLSMLVENADASSVVSQFHTFKIQMRGARRQLLTSDRPITLSAMLIAPDAFMILPHAPDRLLILARDGEIARSFATQDPTVLVEGINQAVVEQSHDIVIASDTQAKGMVDRLFLRPQPGRILDSLGFIRRKSPYRDLRPKVRAFSRRDKASMRYLGS